MTTIRFAGFPIGAEGPRFGAHHGQVSQKLYERARAQAGEQASLPDELRVKTTAEKMGLDGKDASLLTQALNAKASASERKEAVNALQKRLFEGFVLRERVMHVLVAAHAITRELQEKGSKVSLPKPFLKKLLKTVSEFKYEAGRGSLLRDGFPQQYDGPAFPPDIEQAYLKVLLNNNQNDNIHDHESNFTRSVAKSSPENRKLALKEAGWMTTKLALELLEEAIPEEALQNPRHALPNDGHYRICSSSPKGNSPDNEETRLATGQILKRLDETYPKELGRYSLPQLGDAALDLLLELREKQLPTMQLHYELLKRSLEGSEFVLSDRNVMVPIDNSYNKKRPYEAYLKGAPFPDERLESRYVLGLIGKAQSFHLLAYLLDHAHTPDGHPYDIASAVSKKVKELVDPPLPEYMTKSADSIIAHAPTLQSNLKNRALKAWAVLDQAETEVPRELSEWLMERAFPTLKLTFQRMPEIPARIPTPALGDEPVWNL